MKTTMRTSMKVRAVVWGLITVFVCSFAVLLSLGSDIYREAPPLPEKIITVNGDVVFTYSNIDQGQLAWRSMGGHQLGSIWGHGAYVAPDWTADWIHREAQAWLNAVAKELYGLPFSHLTSLQQAALEQQLRDDIRPYSYSPESRTITISDRRAAAIRQVMQHYVSLFGDDPATQQLRIDYAMKNNTLNSVERRENLAAFVFWTAWAATTERPGADYTYTHNWPFDKQVGNDITSSLMVWSILSICGLILGIGALVWYHATLREVPLAAAP